MFLDCWIYNLKHMETLEKMPFEAQHKIFKRLVEIADSKTLTKEEQEKYDNSMMVMWGARYLKYRCTDLAEPVEFLAAHFCY